MGIRVQSFSDLKRESRARHSAPYTLRLSEGCLLAAKAMVKQHQRSQRKVNPCKKSGTGTSVMIQAVLLEMW